MCGIAGILRWGERPVERPEIEAMTSALRHRGPDGQGVLIREPVALGHRRLSIIDLATGAQPMSNEDGQVWVTFNGEIYNYRDLARELSALGHRFASRSDTEVIVHAYEQWGTACVERFSGMFAFAVLDLVQRRLFIARDPLGIKPLVYRVGEGFFAFASELSALRAVEAPTPRGDPYAIELLLRYQYIPHPWTIYRGVRKLPPGSTLDLPLDAAAAAVEPRRYWRFAFKPEPGRTAEQWESEVGDAVRGAVEAQLVSDVPFGVFLSGGVDSTVVAMCMAQTLEQPVEAFNIGFEEAQFSETHHAQQAARTLGIRLHTRTVRADAMAILPRLLKHFGEPFADSSAIPTFHVCELARERVPMVLSGDGGDETFAGYLNYAGWLRSAVGSLARGMLHSPGRRQAHDLFFALTAMRFARNWSRRTEWEGRLAFVPEFRRRELWRPQWRGQMAPPCEAFLDADAHADGLDRLSYAQHMDLHTYLPGDILTKVDIMSMSVGLEARPALLDHRVLDVAARLPAVHRARWEVDRMQGKLPLKAMLRGRFDADFIERKKQGFSLPRALWFLPGHPVRECFEEQLRDPRSRLSSFFEPQAMRATLDRHTPQRDESNTLWALHVLGLWLRDQSEVSFE
jgi:asparagine synthase (glutamine-hydrolysing)